MFNRFEPSKLYKLKQRLLAISFHGYSQQDILMRLTKETHYNWHEIQPISDISDEQFEHFLQVIKLMFDDHLIA